MKKKRRPMENIQRVLLNVRRARLRMRDRLLKDGMFMHGESSDYLRGLEDALDFVCGEHSIADIDKLERS